VWGENNITQTIISGAINNLRQIAIVTCINATEKQLKTFAISLLSDVNDPLGVFNLLLTG